MFEPFYYMECFLFLNIKSHLNNVRMSSTIYLGLIAYGHMLVRQEDLSKFEVKEHTRDAKHCKKGSNIGKQAWDHDHKIDF